MKQFDRRDVLRGLAATPLAGLGLFAPIFETEAAGGQCQSPLITTTTSRRRRRHHKHHHRHHRRRRSSSTSQSCNAGLKVCQNICIPNAAVCCGGQGYYTNCGNSETFQCENGVGQCCNNGGHCSAANAAC
jgi:hypothetical protein